MKTKQKALAKFLGIKTKEVTQGYDENIFEAESSEYLVVTDDEADALWEEDLDNYIDECILHELPEAYRNYFDCEAWKSDARYDGRAHSLARYDGNESEQDGFYIYQTN